MYVYVAVDVSEEVLDCANIKAESGQKVAAKFKNRPAGFEPFYDWALKLAHGAPVVFGFEATGCYSKPLQWFLESKGARVHVFNPRMIRRLAQGLGIAIKNDKVDSYVICKAMMMTGSEGTPCRRKAQDRLRSISREITGLTADRANVKKRLRSPALSPEVEGSLRRQLAGCSAEIKILESQWKELMLQDGQLKRNYEALISIPNVGPKTARVAVSELDEVSEGRTAKQIASYCAVVPHENSSGKTTGHAHLGQGNRYLKRALYMPATRSLRTEEAAHQRYWRLREKGKTHNEAIIPIMHALARRIAAVLKRGTPWSAKPPSIANC